jgi:hypothetical protein
MGTGFSGGFSLTLAFLSRLQSEFNRSGYAVVDVRLAHTHLAVISAPAKSHRTPLVLANVPLSDVMGHGTGSLIVSVLVTLPAKTKTKNWHLAVNVMPDVTQSAVADIVNSTLLPPTLHRKIPPLFNETFVQVSWLTFSG